MEHFDYARAWKELASPAWSATPEPLRDVLRGIAEHARNVNQDRDSLDINAGPIHLGSFASWTLADAARAIYFFGHWKPSPEAGLFYPGTSWKVSNVLDQELTKRIGLTRDRKVGRNGWSFEVHEGALRMCYGSRNEWNWREVGPATAEVYAAAFGVARGKSEDALQLAAKACAPLLSDLWRRWLSVGETYTPNPERDLMLATLATLPEVPAGADFAAVRIENTFDPHPFMIGPRHFPEGGGMFIRPEQAPCAMKRCGMAYGDHKAIPTLFVEVADNKNLESNAELRAWLLAAKPAVEAAKIERIAFPNRVQEVNP